MDHDHSNTHHHHHPQHHPLGQDNEETNPEKMELKHADSDSVNSIPPPPPPMGMVVPVASEESDDITEAERLKLQQELEHDLQMANNQQMQDDCEADDEPLKEHDGVTTIKAGKQKLAIIDIVLTPWDCRSYLHVETFKKAK